MRFGLLLLIAIGFLPGVGRAEAPVVSFTLANGLRVAMEEDHRTPRVAVRVGYGVGWRDGPPGYRGLPHLYEHLMFAGSRHAPGDSFWRLLEEAGATDIDAVTGPDETAYREIVPSHQLALALWLESDRMAFLLDALSEKQLDEQKEAVLKGPSLEGATAGLYPRGHPYRDMPDNSDDIRTITLRAVESFGQRWYRPDQAVLSLVGDFEPGEARELVERYFGPIVASGPASRQTEPPPPLKDRVVDETGGRLRIAWASPPAFDANEAAFMVLASVLEHRLGQTLKLEQALCNDVSVTEWRGALSSELVIEAIPVRGTSPERVLQLIDEELERLRRSAIGTPELTRATQEVVEAGEASRRSLLGRATQLAAWWRAWGSPDGERRDSRRYRDVTPEDVQRAAMTLGSPP